MKYIQTSDFRVGRPALICDTFEAALRQSNASGDRLVAFTPDRTIRVTALTCNRVDLAREKLATTISVLLERQSCAVAVISTATALPIYQAWRRNVQDVTRRT